MCCCERNPLIWIGLLERIFPLACSSGPREMQEYGCACACVYERVRRAMPRSISPIANTSRLAGKAFPGWPAAACHREMPMRVCTCVYEDPKSDARFDTARATSIWTYNEPHFHRSRARDSSGGKTVERWSAGATSSCSICIPLSTIPRPISVQPE